MAVETFAKDAYPLEEAQSFERARNYYIAHAPAGGEFVTRTLPNPDLSDEENQKLKGYEKKTIKGLVGTSIAVGVGSPLVMFPHTTGLPESPVELFFTGLMVAAFGVIMAGMVLMIPFVLGQIVFTNLLLKGRRDYARVSPSAEAAALDFYSAVKKLKVEDLSLTAQEQLAAAEKAMKMHLSKLQQYTLRQETTTEVAEKLEEKIVILAAEAQALVVLLRTKENLIELQDTPTGSLRQAGLAVEEEIVQVTKALAPERSF